MKKLELVDYIDDLLENSDEAQKFERIVDKFSNRADLHAFILLDKLLPNNHNIIGSARHKEIFIDIDMKKLAAVITKEQVVDLIRCGVSYDSHYGCLYMFT